MALINCRECGSNVSDTAYKCPKCGSIAYRPFGSIIPTYLIIGATIIIVTIIAMYYGP